MVRKQLTEKEIEKQKEEQSVESRMLLEHARRSGKSMKTEGKVSKVNCKDKRS